jgi:hypothetical protein
VQIRASGHRRRTADNGPPARAGQLAALARGDMSLIVCLREMAFARPCNKTEIENTYLCNNHRSRVTGPPIDLIGVVTSVLLRVSEITGVC